MGDGDFTSSSAVGELDPESALLGGEFWPPKFSRLPPKLGEAIVEEMRRRGTTRRTTGVVSDCILDTNCNESKRSGMERIKGSSCEIYKGYYGAYVDQARAS